MTTFAIKVHKICTYKKIEICPLQGPGKYNSAILEREDFSACEQFSVMIATQGK